MTLSMAIFTFINAWWISVFLMLPFSIETPEKADEHTTPAAPKKIHWKRIVTGATLLAFFFTLTLALVIKSGIVPVKNMEPL